MSAILNFKVGAGIIRCTSNLTIPANTVKHVKAKFVFEEDWSSYSVKIATFTNQKSGYVRRAILDKDNLCFIPWEVLTGGGTLTIDIEGRVSLPDDTSAIARATTEYSIRLIENIIHSDGSEDTITDTPDILTKTLENIELIERYAAASQSAQENAQRAAESARAAVETEQRVNTTAEELTNAMADIVNKVSMSESISTEALERAKRAGDDVSNLENVVVRHTAQQLTAEQKAQARENIGAMDADSTQAAINDAIDDAMYTVVQLAPQELTDTEQEQVRENIGASGTDVTESIKIDLEPLVAKDITSLFNETGNVDDSTQFILDYAREHYTGKDGCFKLFDGYLMHLCQVVNNPLGLCYVIIKAFSDDAFYHYDVYAFFENDNDATLILSTECYPRDESDMHIDLGRLADLLNRPSYVDHSKAQNLTEQQRARARENIGAVSTEEVVKHTAQQLTDAQKKQARKNIGAAADDPVPDYVISEAEQVIGRILSAQGNRTFTMAVLTDLHYGNGGNTDGVKHACQALKYMDSRFKLDALAVLGDYTDTYPATELENALGDFRQVNALLEGLRSVPNLRLQGNHDYYADNAHITHRYIQSYSQDVIWGDRLGGYFYRDFDAFKLRVICVNTVETGNANLSVSAAQYQWFADALDLSGKAHAEQWQTLILSHHPLDWYEANGQYVFGRVLNAYVNGGSYSLAGVVACDYAGKNAAKLIGNIHGHIHNLLTAPIYRDTGAKLQTGVYRFSSPEACKGRENQYASPWKEAVSYPKTVGTAQDTAFCVYCVDLDARTVKAVCYGAGYDREIDYSALRVLHSVTNQLTNASSSNSMASITAGSAYSAILTPDYGSLTSVTVTMGGTDITDTVYADGVITIAEVTGDIVITAVGEAAPAYTNLLPLATDADGNAYNGGKGWKNGTRLNSSGAEAAYEGVNVTGFIPVALGDVIRFKNMKFTAHSSGAYAGQEYLAFYDENKTKLASAIIGYASALCDAGGGTRREAAPSYNLISLDTAQLVGWSSTANKWSGAGNMAYFRLSAEKIGDDSIITINEEIT